MAKAVGALSALVGLVTGTITLVSLGNNRSFLNATTSALQATGFYWWSFGSIVVLGVIFLQGSGPPPRVIQWVIRPFSDMERESTKTFYVMIVPVLLGWCVGYVLGAGWVIFQESLNEVESDALIMGYIAICASLWFASVWLFSRHQRSRRRCPECAEVVKSAARVCRYCGYRFHPPVDSPDYQS